jgi:hypothetical protein
MAKAMHLNATNTGRKMLRPNGGFGKVREGYLVSVPNRPIHAEKAWRSKGDVFAMLCFPGILGMFLRMRRNLEA